MSQVKVSEVFLDWLTVVAPVGGLNSWLRKFLSTENTRPAHTAYHRQAAIEYYPSGIKHYFTPESTVDGSIMVLSGTAISNIRNDHDNVWVNKMAGVIARSSSHFTRLDIAIDIFDDGYLARTIARDVINGKMKFGRRKATVVMGEGNEGGTTVYVGSRTSPKMLRIYDKNAESNGEIKATRLEFELKAEAAHAAHRIMRAFNGYLKASQLFTGLLLEFGDWERYKAIMDLCYGDVTTLSIPKRERLLDKKAWLTRQVLPTFTVDPDGDSGELWHWFKELVQQSQGSA